MLEITSSQRAKLRGMAMNLQPGAQMGKNGITDAFLQMLDEQLEARELVKINVLRTADMRPRDILSELAERLNAAPVPIVTPPWRTFKIARRLENSPRGRARFSRMQRLATCWSGENI